MSDSLQTLNSAEQTALEFCERRVSEGLDRFRDVGLALASIRDNRLYRGSHATFEDYCRERWGWSARRGYQLMDAAEALAGLPAECEPLVHTERAARELARIEPEKRAEVIADAAKAGPVTAKAIKQAAKAREPEPVEPVREDGQMRELRLTNKANAVLDDLTDYLGGMNPTRKDIIQIAIILHNRANRLERAAAQLPED